MPPESPPLGSVPARRQFENIQSKLQAVNRTLKQLQEMPARPTSIVDRAEELQRKASTLGMRVQKVWSELEQPLHGVARQIEPLDQRARQVRQQWQALKRQAEQSEQHLENLRKSAKAAPADNKQIQDEIRAVEHQHQSNIVSFNSTDATLRSADDAVVNFRKTQQEEQAKFERIAESPLASLNEARKEADQLNEDSKALYDEATKDRTLAAVGEAVDSNRQQFIAALAHHQSEARKLFWFMLASSTAFAGLVVLSFLMLPSTAIASDGKTDWAHVLVVLGGRLSIILGAAWLVAFVGKLHSRHSQQAVSYQDRLAGIDVIGMMLQHGTQTTRDVTLKRMTEFYLTQEDNAFRDPPTRDATLKDVSRLLTTVTEPVSKAVESIATSISKGKG